MSEWSHGHAPKHFIFPVNRSSWNLRSHGSIFLYQPFAHTNSYLHSCVPSPVSLWNQLPENFHHCLSLPSFKFLIDSIVFFFRVNFALAYAICSSCVYIYLIYILQICIKKKAIDLGRLAGLQHGHNTLLNLHNMP